MTGSFLLCLPTCLCIGLFFPIACALVKEDSPVSRVYTFEAFGSMAGGVIITFVLLKVLDPYRIILTASCIGLAGAVIVLALKRTATIVLAVLCCLLLCVALAPAMVAPLESWTSRLRLRAAGILPQDADDETTVLVASADTVHQNLVLVESYGQYAMYGHGHIMFAFPDPATSEHTVHSVMAQKPTARTVLLLGGNPLDEIPEFLKYPIERLVYVELDPGIGRMLRKVMPDEYGRLFESDRVKAVFGDAPRFVSECSEKFDVIIVHAPQPSTSWENRFYTLEFYDDVKRILNDDGFMQTAVKLSARLQSDTANLGGTVFKTLKQVFPVVLATAGDVSRMFAGGESSGLTMDRNVLLERSRGAGITNEYFRPEFFLGDDTIAPEKRRQVEARLLSANVPLNTTSQPVTYYYNLLIWSTVSGSGLGRVLQNLQTVDYRLIALAFLVFGALCYLTGRSLRGSARWARFATGTIIGTTGFCAMALEIVLIFIFQSMFGYVYSKMGLIVAMFMLGLVAGAPSGRAMSVRGARPAWLAFLCLEAILLAIALLVPMCLKTSSQLLIYIAVVFLGWAVGAEFPLGNRLFRNAGGTVSRAAGITDASDHIGAACGALIVGVLLIPLFGIWAACIIVASMKCAGILMLLGVRPRRHQGIEALSVND
jgi:spermidine synthase